MKKTHQTWASRLEEDSKKWLEISNIIFEIKNTIYGFNGRITTAGECIKKDPKIHNVAQGDGNIKE